jgi:hypothetical protein
VAAVYFDGRHSTPHAVTLKVESATLIVDGVTVNRTVSLHELDISEALGTSPRLIRFGDGAFCEVDAAALQMLLGQKGMASRPVSRWEGSVRWVVAAALLFVATLIAAYRYAVPAIAVVAANQVPAPIVDIHRPTSDGRSRHADIRADHRVIGSTSKTRRTFPPCPISSGRLLRHFRGHFS